MDATVLLDDALSRLPDLVRDAVADLDDLDLAWSPAPGANPIGWLVWHLTRVQDAQIAPLVDAEQLWTRAGWADHFGIPDGANDHGYGWSTDQVAAFEAPSARVLLDHLDAVNDRCRELVAGLSADDLDRVIDASYDPPVTLGTRLVSVIDDAAQHAGQVGYVRGLLDASRSPT
ncbi:mycothiol transferase [Nitriliruptor alkaliphilus]|uniref:mycothiol transferase n=1 Tax=Nitriliruptor alkaliphilus TaxID=427918 RepID=UPI0006982EDB|nr:DinB family protein [Nitriliruptor alkaliphilus]